MSAQFWSNVGIGIGGTYERPIPYVTACRIIHGTQKIYFTNIRCITRAAYLQICNSLANYLYDELPFWEELVLHPGDTLSVSFSGQITRLNLSQGVPTITLHRRAFRG
jgi:hypothetical protein